MEMNQFIEVITSSEKSLSRKNVIFEPVEVDLVPKGSVPKDVLDDLGISENDKVTIYRNSVGVHGYVSETGAYFNLPALPSLDIMALKPEEVMIHRMYLLVTIKLLLKGLDKDVDDSILDKVIQYDFFNEMEKTSVTVNGYTFETTPANSFIHIYIFKSVS